MIRFFLKTLFIHFLVVLLVEGQNPFITPFLVNSAFAEENPNDALGDIVSSYQLLLSQTEGGQPNAQTVMNNLQSPDGEAMLNRGQAFIADPANAALLATAQGQELVGLHDRYTRLTKIKNQLDDCFASGDYLALKENGFTAALPERVFAAAWNSPDTNLPCDPQFFEAQSIDGLFGGVSNVIETIEAEERVNTLNTLQQEIGDKNLENAVQSFVSLEVIYSGADLSQGAPLNDSEINDIVRQVCHGSSRILGNPDNRTLRNNPNRCSREQREMLRAAAIKKQEELMAQNIETYSPAEAAAEIKSGFDALNERINNEDTFQLDVDLRWNNTIEDTPQSQGAIQAYADGYGEILGSHPGMLALTGAVSDDTGGRRDQAQKVFGIFGSGGVDWEAKRFLPHDTSNLSEGRGARTIEAAISESKDMVLGQARRVFSADRELREDMASYNAMAGNWSLRYNNANDIVENREESLTEIIRRNPASVGQVLMKNPALTQEACRIMRNIAEENEDEGTRDGWETAFLYAGLALGAVALGGIGILAVGGLMFGLGAAGAVLSGGTLAAVTAGTGTMAFGGMILSSLAVPGLIYGVIESAEASNRFFEERAERDALADSYMSGAGDEATLTEYWAAEEAARTAAWEAGIALTFSAIDLPVAMAVARGLRGRSLVQYWNRIENFFTNVRNTPQLSRRLRVARDLLGRARYMEVIGQMSKFDNFDDIMRRIKDLPMDDVREIFRRSSAICQRSCL